MQRLRLLVRAVLWRRSSSAAVLVAAAAAFAAACLGPLWAAATSDALSTRALNEPLPAQRSLTLEQQANVRRTGTGTIPLIALREVQEVSVLPPPLEAAFDAPRLSLTTIGRTRAVGVDERAALISLAWREQGCEALRLVQGRCPTSTTELAVSDRAAAFLGVAAGQSIRLPGLSIEPERPGEGTPFPLDYVVSGVYLPGDPDDATWAGTRAFLFRPPQPAGGETLPATLDTAFGTRELLEGLALTEVEARAQRVLLPAERTAPEIAEIAAAAAPWAEDLRSRQGRLQLEDPVNEVLAGIAPQVEAAERASLVLGLQLLLLGCWVLTLVVTSSSEGRVVEAALGNLRGLRRRTLAVVGLGEPLLLVLVALPLGVAAGAGLTSLLVGALLPGDVPLRVDTSLPVVLGVALAASVVAVAGGVRRLLGRSVLDVTGPAEGAVGGSPLRLAAEAAAVTLALVAVARVVEGDGGSGDGLGLLAPALAAVAAGVLLARGLSLLVKPWTRRTRRRGSLAGFLASRRLARRGAAVRTVVLVAVAVAASAYAAGVLAVTAEQREAQAAMEVGATTAYAVQPVVLDDLLAAVGTADPRGEHLAAAVVSGEEGRDDGEQLVALDAPRLAAAASWRDEWSGPGLDDLAQRLRPPTAPSLVLTGSQVTVELATSFARETAGLASYALEVVRPDGTSDTVLLGAVQDGNQTLTAALPGCEDGCRLSRLDVKRTTPEVRSLIGMVRYVRLLVDGTEVPGAFTEQGGWRPAPINALSATGFPSSTVEIDEAGLRMRFATLPDDEAGVVRADTPEGVPLLAAGVVDLRQVGRDDLVIAEDLAQEPVVARVVGRTTVLPRLGDGGLLTDLTLLQRAAPLVDDDATYEVWSARPPSEAVEADLEAAGLQVTGFRTAADRLVALEAGGPALVLSLLPVMALAAVAVAALALSAAALSESRARAVETAALATVGVPRRVLRRAALRESLLLVVLGAVGGLAAGVVTASLTAPEVGALGLVGALAPFPDRLPLPGVAVATALAVAGLAVVCLACARVGVRRAEPGLLRQVAG